MRIFIKRRRYEFAKHNFYLRVESVTIADILKPLIGLVTRNKQNNKHRIQHLLDWYRVYDNMTSTPTLTPPLSSSSGPFINLTQATGVPAQTELLDWNAATGQPGDDTVIEASRIADESAPDGGYGWVIVAACSLMTFWFVGTTYSWGVIQEVLVEDGLAKASTLAFVGSLAVACIAAFAIVNARLVRAIGARKAAFVGILLMGLGQILSGWAMKSIAGLFITQGLVMGYGVR